MFRKKGFWIVLILVLIASIGGYLISTGVLGREQAESATPEVQTTKVRRGDLIISATGAGALVAVRELELAFPSGGTLIELNVEIGDKVKAGDPLARLEDLNARQSLANAKTQLDKTQSELTDAQDNLKELLEGPSAAEKLAAEAAVQSTQEKLDDLLEEATASELASAEANLATAQEAHERLVDGPSDSEIELKRLAVDRSKNSLWSAQMSRDATGGRQGSGPGTSAYDSAEAAVLNAEISVRQAEIALEELLEPATEAELEEGEARVAQVQQQLADLQEGASDAEIASARAQLAKAQEDLDELLASPSEMEIETAQTRVRQAELQLQQNELSLEAAQQDLDDTTLLAPIDGTVTAVTADAGERVGSGALITLADLSQPLVEIYLDESDTGMLAVGYEVEVIFDALIDETFRGQVIKVYPSLTREEGMDVIGGLVELDSQSFGKPRPLPLGLNATVDVIGGRAENALLVPVDALRELDPGEYAVFVMENGKPKLRQVKIGLQDYTYAEVIEGLALGDTVTTGIVETR